MDTTPVMRRSRSKLSRRDRSTPSQTLAAPPADRRTPAETAFSTPLRAPPVDSACWDSPVSPFSPPMLSQTCEVYWEDEAQRRIVEELKRAVNRPGDRVPPLPPPLVASPAPLLPAGRRRVLRATRQQQQQLMALLEQAETLCGRPSSPAAAPTAEDEPEPAPPPAECTAGSDTGGGLPEIESDPELDRSMLRCTQQAERAVTAAPATPTDTPGRRARSFNADVMDAMPDDEDDIFSQIPDDALNGVNGEAKPTASGSSSGVSSGSGAPPRPAGRGRGLTRAASATDHRPPGRAPPVCRVFSASQTTASRATETLAGIAESANSSGGSWRSSSVMKPTVGSSNSKSMSRSSTGFSDNTPAARQFVTSNSSDVVMKTPATANSSGATNPTVNSAATRAQVNPARGPVSGAAGVATSNQRLPDSGPHRPAAAAAAAPADPFRQKAEMNRRRAQALRRLRENQRARSTAVRAQTR